MGSYAITIKLSTNGYILAANPEFDQSGRSLAAFYGNQTGIITYNSSGEPAGRHDEEFLDINLLPMAVRDMAR